MVAGVQLEKRPRLTLPGTKKGEEEECTIETARGKSQRRNTLLLSLATRGGSLGRNMELLTG